MEREGAGTPGCSGVPISEKNDNAQYCGKQAANKQLAIATAVYKEQQSRSQTECCDQGQLSGAGIAVHHKCGADAKKNIITE